MRTETNKAVVRRYIEEVINRGKFDASFLGIPATGKSIEAHACSIYFFEDPRGYQKYYLQKDVA